MREERRPCSRHRERRVSHKVNLALVVTQIQETSLEAAVSCLNRLCFYFLVQQMNLGRVKGEFTTVQKWFGLVDQKGEDEPPPLERSVGGNLLLFQDDLSLTAGLHAATEI